MGGWEFAQLRVGEERGLRKETERMEVRGWGETGKRDEGAGQRASVSEKMRQGQEQTRTADQLSAERHDSFSWLWYAASMAERMRGQSLHS